MFGDCRFAAASFVPFLSLVLPALPALAPPSTRILDPNRDELLLPLHWRPPCWKRGGEFRQIDDNRWSAIRQGGVPQSRNSLTWGFAGAFFSLRPACRKTARFAPCDHRLSCVCPNSGAFSQQPPPPRIPGGIVVATTAPSANPLCCASLCLPRLAARNSSPRIPPRSAIVNNFAIFLNMGGCLLKS